MTLRSWIPLAAPVPALIIGALVMRDNGVGRTLWGTNLIVGALAIAACAALRARPQAARRPWLTMLGGSFGLILLLLTFTNDGIMGVHRWLSLGPITLHGGAVAVPLVILAVAALLANPARATSGLILAGVTALVLTAQPDVAQAFGLAAAAVILVVMSPVRGFRAWASAGLVAAVAGYSWFRNDPLAPVPHVEGILRLAAESGWIWLAASILSLAACLLPFLPSRDNPNDAVSRALGVYVAVCIVVPLVRPYPVPLLGFGISPIIGYAIALAATFRRPPGAAAFQGPGRHHVAPRADRSSLA